MEESFTQIFFEDLCQDIFLSEKTKYSYSLVSDSNPSNKVTVYVKIISAYQVSNKHDSFIHKALRRSAADYARANGINNFIPYVIKKNKYTLEACYIDLDKLELRNLFGKIVGDVLSFKISYNQTLIKELQNKIKELKKGSEYEKE